MRPCTHDSDRRLTRADGAAGGRTLTLRPHYGADRLVGQVGGRSAPVDERILIRIRFEPDPAVGPSRWDDCAVAYEDDLITPRTKELLAIAGEMLRDEGRSDIDDSTDHWLLFDRYPRITHTREAAWRLRALQSFDDLVAAMNNDRNPYPNCTGDELALWFMIELAAAFEQDRDAWPTVWSAVAALPARPDDFNWHQLRESLFQDHDFLMLYSPDLDGIEDPDNEDNAAMGIGPYLRPQQWFTPFGESAN